MEHKELAQTWALISMDVAYDDIKYKLVLLPLWLMTYKYGMHVLYMSINRQLMIPFVQLPQMFKIKLRKVF